MADEVVPQTADDLAAQLAEVDAQLAEMIGSADISLGGLTVDETQLQKNLMERKTSLEWRIANAASGGSVSATAGGSAGLGGY